MCIFAVSIIVVADFGISTTMDCAQMGKNRTVIGTVSVTKDKEYENGMRFH